MSRSGSPDCVRWIRSLVSGSTERRMIPRILVIVVLISAAECWDSGKSVNLESSLQRTVEFFRELKQDYEKAIPDNDLLAEINYKIAEHTRNSKHRIPRSTPEKGFVVLDGFQEALDFGPTDVQDLSFFALETQPGTTSWFTGIVNADGLSVFRINDTDLNRIGSHPQSDYTRIIAEYCENGVLLILKNQNGAIEIFRLTKLATKYILQPIQDFINKDVTDLTTWHGMNQLYLGVATPRSISIYTWLGEHFDLVQTLSLGARRLVPFYGKGSMHVAAAGASTTILRHSLRTNNFEVLQRLRASKSVSSFHLVDGHRTDHFLALSDEENTIVYKEVHDRFVPFQKLDSATDCLAMVFEKAMVLLTLSKDTLNVYQYDGWRFVKLGTRVHGVEEVRKIRLSTEELLLVKRNGGWKLERITWATGKSWRGLQDDIKQWCEEARVKARRIPVEIPRFNGTLIIQSGHVENLRATEINGHNANESLGILRKLEDLSSKLDNQKESLAAKKWPTNLILDSLKAKRVNVKCNTTCKVRQVNVRKTGDPFQRSRNAQEENGILKFKYLRVKDTPSLPCPLPSVSTGNLVVRGLSNGQNFEEMSENLLRTRGNQRITGEHTVKSMKVNGTVSPLDVAIKSTKQMVEVGKLKVGELHLTEGGFLLPLNGPATVMPGSIKAARVRLKKLPILRGALKGLENMIPSRLEMTPLYLKNDYDLGNIVIEDVLNASDIISASGKSINDILSNALRLGEDVPVNMEVSTDNMNWKNVNLPGFKNFVTLNSTETLNITGRKHVTRDVILAKDIYKNLKLPKIEGELCGKSASVSELKTSTLSVDNLRADRIHSSRVIGRLGKSETRRLFDLPKDRVYRKLTVKNLMVEKVNDATVNEELLKEFEAPNLYKGSLNVGNLSVDVLDGPLNFPLQTTVREIVSKANTYVGTINGVNLKEFLDNAATVHDNLPLGNVFFESGLSSNDTVATHLPFKLQSQNANFIWKTKRISGDLDTLSINIPQSFDYNNNESAVIFIQGSAEFRVEPSVENINDINMKELANSTWMKNQSTVLAGSNLHLENITINGEAIVQGSVLSARDSERWGDLFDRILSRTRLQEIKVPISLNKLEAPFISGTPRSTVKSDVSDLNDILENALTTKGPQEITGKWNFHLLNLTADMELRGKVNGLDLSKDVVRHDVKENLITGRKKVLDLSTKDLNGLNFDKLATQAFVENKRKLTTIKGRRTFGVLRLQNLSVFGTVMGRRMEHAMLKSTNQSIFGARIIDGNVEAPGLIVDGLVNDVNLTEIMSSQLKKRAPSQVVSSDVEFLGSLDVLGNVTISSLDSGRNRKDFDGPQSNTSADKSLEFLEALDAIGSALKSRAFYVNKFEIVPMNSIDLSHTNAQENAVAPIKNCELRNAFAECGNQEAIKAVMSSIGDFIVVKSIANEKELLIVAVQRKKVSIYTLDENRKDIHLVNELSIPRIEEAMVEPLKDSLWIVLQLPGETLLLRHESWQELQDYVLPRTQVLRTARTPSNELLLLLSDGIWELEGSGEPRKIFETPLKGEIQSFSRGVDFYVASTYENHTTLLKARYSGH